MDKEGKRITPKNSAKILGITVQSNFLWSQHLELGKDSIVSKCKKSMGALKFAARGSSLIIKKRLVDAVIMSRLIYGIQLWGPGSCNTVIRRIQLVQNLTMAWISGLSRQTRTKDLPKNVGWLSINQLIYYYGFLTIYKVKKNNFIHLNAGITRRGRIDLTKRRLSSMIQSIYNSLEPNIWNEAKISVFKKKVKTWIKNNIGVFKCDE